MLADVGGDRDRQRAPLPRRRRAGATSWSGRCAASRRRPRSPARSAARPTSSACSSWSSSAAARWSRRAALLILLRDGDELVVAAGGRRAEVDVVGQRHPGRRLDRRPSVLRARRAASASPTSRTQLRLRARRASRRRRPRCSCRSSSAAQALGVLGAFDRLGGDGRVHATRTSGSMAPSRPAPRPRSRPRRPSQRRAPAPQHRGGRGASAAAGRASCTTRRCRGWRPARSLLASARRARRPERCRRRSTTAVEQVDADDHPRPARDDHRPAARGAGRARREGRRSRRSWSGCGATRRLEIELEVDLDFEAGRAPQRLAPEIESAVYRLVQEALTNVVKHADATTVGSRSSRTSEHRRGQRRRRRGRLRRARDARGLRADRDDASGRRWLAAAQGAVVAQQRDDPFHPARLAAPERTSSRHSTTAHRQRCVAASTARGSPPATHP